MAVHIHLPSGAHFSQIILHTNPENPDTNCLQLFPNEIDLEINQVFATSVLEGLNAEVLAMAEEPTLTQEIQVKGNAIQVALEILLAGNYIDKATKASLQLPNREPTKTALQPLNERLQSFVAENEKETPQKYIHQLIPLLLEYTHTMPIAEIITCAQGYFKIAWVKGAIESQLKEAVNKESSQALEAAVTHLETLAAKEHVSHQEALELLQASAEAIKAYTPQQEGISKEVQTRVEEAANKISNLIPPFDLTDRKQQLINQEIQTIWADSLMAKLGLNIPCTILMNTEVDHEVAKLIEQEEQEKNLLEDHNLALLLAQEEANNSALEDQELAQLLRFQQEANSDEG